MRLTLEFDTEEYPTLDGYRRLLEDIETKALVCTDIIEEETTIDVLRELGRKPRRIGPLPAGDDRHA